MIYLRQIFNLHPASPRTRDAFCQITEERFLPALNDRGTRLIAAWFSHAEWFSQIEHVLTFENLADFEQYRADLVGTGALGGGPGGGGGAAAGGGGRRGPRRGTLMAETVSTKFKNQLGQLMKIIQATSVQYVRCIKVRWNAAHR